MTIAEILRFTLNAAGIICLVIAFFIAPDWVKMAAVGFTLYSIRD